MNELCRSALAFVERPPALLNWNVVRQDLINEHFLNPQNVGAIERPDGSGKAASFTCGGLVRIALRVGADRKIHDAKFKAIGCHVLVASASLLTQEIRGKTTAEAAQMAQYRRSYSGFALNAYQPSARPAECRALCYDALLSAISEYSDSIREDWVGDDALICTCFGVTEREIEQQISCQSLKTIDDVTRSSNAGAGCGSCSSLIQDILDCHLRESRL